MEDCWQLVKCERKTSCPAYPKYGRECFAVTAALCGEETQGSYEDKIARCRQECAFYKHLTGGGASQDLWAWTPDACGAGSIIKSLG